MERKQARIPVLKPGYTYASVTDTISDIVLTRRTPRFWWIGFLAAFLLVNVFLLAVTYLLVRGVGIWGINIPVGWGFAIVNFVWWIGIGGCRYADLGHPAALAPGLAHLDQPLCRG